MQASELVATKARPPAAGVLAPRTWVSVWLAGWLTAIAVHPGTGHGAPVEPFDTGRFIEGVACRTDSTQTYALYLPPGYPDDRTWPALLVFDPRGRAVPAAARFREAAETYGWIILSSNDTRSDASWDINAKALEALWPEVRSRFAVDRRRIYAAGFSGGVLVAWYLAQFATRPSLAGILAAGGRPAPEIPATSVRFAHFGTAGHLDFNHAAMKLLDALVEKSGAPRQFRTFEGRHQWMPPELALEGVEWMEILAMRSGKRVRDAQIVEHVFQKRVAEARALEAGGQHLEALRRYVSIADTWEGLRSVAGIRKTLVQLENEPTVAGELEDERLAEEFEVRTRERMAPAMNDLKEGRPPDSWQDYVDELRIHDLKKTATDSSRTGFAAQRVLEWIFARTSFYVARDHLNDQRYGEAATVLRVAAEIHPRWPRVWYDLARALARHGDYDGSLDALRRAIDNGYDDLARMQADPDLDSIRSLPAYERATAKLRGAATSRSR